MNLLPSDMKAEPTLPSSGGGSGTPPKPPAPPVPAAPAAPLAAPKPPVVPLASAAIAAKPSVPETKPPSAAPVPSSLKPAINAAAPPLASKPSPSAATSAGIAPVKAAGLDSITFGGGLRVSLLPNQLEGSEAPDIRKRSLILAIVLIAETVLIGVAYYFVLQSAGASEARKAVAEKSIADMMMPIKDAETALAAAKAWNAQLNSSKETLDKHLRWTALIGLIEARTLPTVKYTSFSGNADGSVTLEAVAASYMDAAQQIVVWRSEPLVTEVRTSGAAARVGAQGDIQGVTFTLSMKFNPEAWKSPVGN